MLVFKKTIHFMQRPFKPFERINVSFIQIILTVISTFVFLAVAFLIGACTPEQMGILGTESLRPVHLNKTDGSYGLELDFNTILGVSKHIFIANNERKQLVCRQM